MTSRSPRNPGLPRSIGVLLTALLLVGLLPGAVLGAAATKLVITSVVPASQTSGLAFNVTLQAQDGSSAIDTGFTGAVTFTTSDAAATVSPASPYTYTVGDAGTKTFAVTLKSFGSRTFAFSSGALTPTATQTVTVTASKLVFTVTPSGGASGAVWATQPVVQVQDETGAVVTTSTATITLAIGTNPAAGTLSGCAGLTAAAGVVTVTGCKIDKAGVGYTLVASSSGLASGTSGPFNITPGAAFQLAFTTQPARGTPAGAFASQPVVEIEDAAGNRVTGDSTTSVSLTISTNPGSGTLTCSGGLARVAAAGLATFSGCSINNVGVGYRITAAAAGLGSAVSGLFDVADRLVFTTQPSASTAAGVVFATQPVVAVRAGATDTAVNDSATQVTLSLSGGPAGAVLTCTSNPLTVTAGVATFAGCKIDRIGTYTLVASATTLGTVTSTSLTITAGPATKLGFTAQPNAGVVAQPFPIQPVVAVQDAGGNTVTTGTNSTATITLSLAAGAPAGAILTCTGGLSKVAVAGVAAFAGCSVNIAGTYTLLANATGLTAATGTAFVVTVAGAAITLTNSASVITWGGSVVLTVQFGTNGANKAFLLEGARDGITWTTRASLTTNAAGQATFTYRPAINQYYRARFLGTADLVAGTSNTTRTTVRQIALLRPTNFGAIRSIARNTSITFTTTARPARPELPRVKVSFVFYRRVGSVWTRVAKRDVIINSLGKSSTTFKFTRSGSWYVRTIANPTPYNANSVWSPLERYRVR
jgi:hypothetical protein